MKAHNAKAFLINAGGFSLIAMIGSGIGVKAWQTLVIGILVIIWNQLRVEYK